MEFYFFLFLAFNLLQGLQAGPPVQVTPNRIILLENKPLEVRCRVAAPITYCRFSVPGIQEGLSLRPRIPPHMGIQYIGEGLDKGECGMLIQRVSSKYSGTIQCSMGFTDTPTESTGNLTLIVAKPPDPPLLSVSPGVSTGKDVFHEGEVIRVNCKIRNARPIANISWFLGSEPIFDNLGPPISEEENGLMTISQNLTRKVTYLDHGKDLKCVAGHIALGQGNINHSLHKINVLFPPKPKSQELEKFGFTIGQPGRIVVTFQANPIPDIVWKVDQDNLKQGTRDRTGRYEAGVLQHRGAGIWDAILNINTVRAEEVEKRYTLVAQNEYGREAYKVAISTSPEPPADITAGAIVGIVIAVLVILLLVFILIFARATGRWCFAGGLPRLQGESKPSLRWSLPVGNLRQTKKVNSLIYKDYSLMKQEDGTKSYVSPEKQAELLAQEKIKKSQAKESVDNEKIKKKFRKVEREDSDSDSAYETPISTTDNSSFVKPKSCGDLDKMSAFSVPQRNSSFSCFEENFGGNNGKINLPPFIKPLETSLTLPSIKKKNREKKKKRDSSDSFDDKRETKMNFEISRPKEEMGKLNNMPEFNRNKEKGRDEVDGKKIFFARRSIPSWEKEKEKSKSCKFLPETKVNEPITKESSFKLSKKRFSLPWTKDKENFYSLEEPKSEFDDVESIKYSLDNEEVDSPNSLQHFSFKPLLLSETKGNKFEKLTDDQFEFDKGDSIMSEDGNYYSKFLPESKSSLLELIDKKMVQNLKEPEEIFPEEEEVPKTDQKYGIKGFIPTVTNGINKSNLENENSMNTNFFQHSPKRYSFGLSLLRYPDNLAEPKPRKFRNIEKVDRNPLKKMFGIRNTQRMQKDNIEPEKKPQNLNIDHKLDHENMNLEEADSNLEKIDSLDDSDMGKSSKTFLANEEKLKSTNHFSQPKVNVETDIPSHRLTCESGKLGLTGEKQFNFDEIQTNRSDTESADHGSADKSSVSKLTTQKQPKKLMSGLLGSFKKGRTKDRIIDADSTINPPSLEITIKEQAEEVHMNGTPKAEGIVYAELDMARPGGNLMRRDEGEKTEYAEIIYPSSKLAPERTIDELRKSRENLASSREDFPEAEDVFTTTITPDGKKEAAV